MLFLILIINRCRGAKKPYAEVLNTGGNPVLLAQWAQEILDGMEQVAARMDALGTGQEYTAAVALGRSRLQ